MPSTYFRVEGVMKTPKERYTKGGQRMVDLVILPLKSLGDREAPIEGSFNLFGKMADEVLNQVSSLVGTVVEVTGEIVFRVWQEKTYPNFRVTSIIPKVGLSPIGGGYEEPTRFKGEIETTEDVPF